jgi:hypothetical protein|nr:MAG TPA: Protein of unknown function (DUF763) [Caudoviricetes sp.]
MTPKELYEWAAKMGISDTQIKVVSRVSCVFSEHDLTDNEVATDGFNLILEINP